MKIDVIGVFVHLSVFSLPALARLLVWLAVVRQDKGIAGACTLLLLGYCMPMHLLKVGERVQACRSLLAVGLSFSYILLLGFATPFFTPFTVQCLLLGLQAVRC